ncbi:ATP-binding cassette domain-containing protein [Streptomyces sp. SID3343]|uniref:ABC transporter ATP-binding protein n=1 Tax=Streptomyces sp. SID3343 TaxID=2690260 RepID=UPI001367E763|nr:ATP-binding cassette domain-containing protein [Streptomyces sp. SID3343]MYW01965.1 ATP-binding cassette domain-containing protein [Streptomyces sp. SID3343]
MPIAVSVNGLRVRYGPIEALHGVDLEFPAGAVTALIGRNGSGRTTLLNTLAGLVRPVAGTVTWLGEDITTWPADKRARAGVTLIPERGGIFPGLSVADNLTVFANGTDTTGRTQGGDIEPALAAFPVLEARLAQKARTLSGGEQQMLAVSRALLRPAKLLLLDELSQGLAPRIAGRLYEVVADLATADRTVILVEQHTGEALHRAEVVYTLSRGSVTFRGDPTEFRSRPQTTHRT